MKIENQLEMLHIMTIATNTQRRMCEKILQEKEPKPETCKNITRAYLELMKGHLKGIEDEWL